MKFFLMGRYLEDLRSALAAADLADQITEDAAKADLIITHGGDGAMLGAERLYPGCLKFPIRDAATAPLCPAHGLSMQLELLKSDSLKKTMLPKICGSVNGRCMKAINDVFIHNRDYVSAMRYNVWIDGELYGKEIVGDGVGLSTVHGATAYYRSITHSIFRTGIGLAFSNSTELVNHLVLPETSVVRVQVLRGPCEMVADNSPEKIELQEGDEAILGLCEDSTPILGLDIFMCPECRARRHSLRCTLPCCN